MAFAATMILASSCTEEQKSEPNPTPDNNVNFTATKFTGMHMLFNNSNSYMVVLSDDESIYNYMFTLNGPSGEIDDNGNITIPSGTYTYSEEKADYTISGYTSYIDMSGGEGNSKTLTLTEPTAVVSDNKIVLTTVIEGVTHVVTYNGALSMAAKLPEPNVDFVANYAHAYYTPTTSVDNVARFKLFLSDKGLDEGGNALPNGTYYRFTLCVNQFAPGAEIAIPAGRYEVDNSSSTAGTVRDVVCYKFSDDLAGDYDFDTSNSGYITINEDGTIEATLEMIFSNSTHTITFSGEVEILKNTMASEAPYSTLTSSKECDLSNHYPSYDYGGKVYGNGYQSWEVSIIANNSYGDHISFEILCGTDENADIAGRYTVSDSLEEYTIIPGYVDGFTLMSSWFYYYDSAMHISDFAPVVEGWVEIETVNKTISSIKFSVYDDLNNNITGTCTYAVPTMASGTSL